MSVNKKQVWAFSYSHNKSATLIEDGKITCAIEEDRLTRIKHSPNISSKPDTAINYLPHATISQENECEILQDHHLAHAYSCYPICGFEKSLVLVIDGMGDDESFLRCTSLYRGENNKLTLQYAQHMPHSLGAYYNLFTELFFNFGYLEEGKTMGLSSYGEPHNNYYSHLKELLLIKNNEIKLNPDYFRFVLSESKYQKYKKEFEKFFQDTNMDFPIEFSRDFQTLYSNDHPWTLMKQEHIKKFSYYKKDYEIFFNFPCCVTFKDNVMDLLGQPRLKQSDPFTQRHNDIAWAVQKRLEDAIFTLVNKLEQFNPDIKKLAMAGGVALNCVANAKIYANSNVDEIFVQPSASDSGLSLGHAVAGHLKKYPLVPLQPFNTAFLGREYPNTEIEKILNDYKNNQLCVSKFVSYTKDNEINKLVYSISTVNDTITKEISFSEVQADRAIFTIPFSATDKAISYYFCETEPLIRGPKVFNILLPNILYRQEADVFAITAKLLAAGKIVAWFQGSSEYGPRALGHRSILTAPFPAEMKDILNDRVKHRESFRPFAGAILEEKVLDYFHLPNSIQHKKFSKSPYMLFAYEAKEKAIKECPAVVHVDNTCRLQIVHESEEPGSNKELYRLIKEFYNITSIPMILNTSFNIAGDPIVETPYDAFYTFLNTNIDVLVLHNYIITKI